ncbi:hypothetical protein [Fuchsiella alkaliacetigena]|uniref:hypothetical protein n=1 Tax=Fuchsiella alkaliacetigena TaxID=957042 RepID=UPI00200A62BA|nr:hypothetical protein [Fuchsiella alkaliacetigena]MCK8823858.1 hypothetical protein [Fuchsiella alkaliacetigena]
MGYEKEIDLSSSKPRFNYLDKLNFAKNLVIDLLPAEQEIKSKMKLLYNELEKLTEILANKNSERAQQMIKDSDGFLSFVYFASEEEIYLKIKDKFDLDPSYSWQVCNKIYDRLNEISKQIDNLSEITAEDISQIQKSLMQIAIIFNNNLCQELNENKYLVRHLNAIYHCLRGEFNESLYQNGSLKTEWDALAKAKSEYERALDFDENLVKAQEKLAKIEKIVI